MDRQKSKQTDKNAKFRLMTAMFIFGTIGIFVRNIPLPSSVIALARGVIGTLFLIIFTKIRKIKISYTEIKNNLSILCLSGMLIGIHWIFLFEAYRNTTVAVATLCYYLAPVFVIIASPFVLKEKLTFKQIVCIGVALIGMIFVSGIFEKGGTENLQLKGIFFGIGAAIIYAVVILLNKHLKKISSYTMTIMQLGIAAAVLAPYTLLTQNTASLTFNFTTLILLGIIGIINTGITYTLYFSAIQELKAHTIAIFSYIDPIVAILLSTLILREKPDVFTVIGGIMILGSTLISELSS
jgi:transporter, eamA family